MDANECNTTHLDADVRLPPRKRLLAGLKKQSCSESTSPCSHENNPSPSPSPSFTVNPLSEFDVRLSDLLKSYKNGSNMSPEEIAQAAATAATAAAKAAETARTAAEEKASIAAKAVAAAKDALNLVASISDETDSKDKYLKKSKLKKHVPVQLLYNKYQPVESCGTDEEVARRLHRAMNSSPRIAKPSPGSDTKNQKQKKLKFSPPSEKSSIVNGTSAKDGNAKLPSACDGDVTEGGMDYEGSNEEPVTVKLDDKVAKTTKPDEVEVNSGETASIQSKEKTFEALDDVCTNGRKRGRIKQKKLPLSLCSSKDQSNPREDQNLTNSLFPKPRTDKPTSRHVSLLSLDPPSESVAPLEVAPTWKCQDFKVSQCLKQDKFVQS